MGIYAYCGVPAGHAPPPGLHGLEGSAVELLPVAGIGVWISRIGQPQVGVAAIEVHNQVVEAAVTEEVTPVPLRFGQWLPDEAALTEKITEKAALYREQLEQFAGCLEFGLRLIEAETSGRAQDVHGSPAQSGLEYMQALRERTRQADQKRALAEQIRSRIHETLQDLILDEREAEGRTPHAVLTLSHLVARRHFDEYRERARELRKVFPAMRLLLSGPWPPYSFAA